MLDCCSAPSAYPSTASRSTKLFHPTCIFISIDQVWRKHWERDVARLEYLLRQKALASVKIPVQISTLLRTSIFLFNISPHLWWPLWQRYCSLCESRFFCGSPHLQRRRNDHFPCISIRPNTLLKTPSSKTSSSPTVVTGREILRSIFYYGHNQMRQIAETPQRFVPSVCVPET